MKSILNAGLIYTKSNKSIFNVGIMLMKRKKFSVKIESLQQWKSIEFLLNASILFMKIDTLLMKPVKY